MIARVRLPLFQPLCVPDGDARRARVLAIDRDRDVAALVVEASQLAAIELGRSRDLRPGEWVLALGHPWSLPGAATGGVVIGTGTDFPDIPLSGQDWIAISLPLRPGNSGGPTGGRQYHDGGAGGRDGGASGHGKGFSQAGAEYDSSVNSATILQ